MILFSILAAALAALFLIGGIALAGWVVLIVVLTIGRTIGSARRTTNRNLFR